MAKHQRTTRRTKLTAAITAVAAAAGVTLFGTSFAGAAPAPMGTVYGADAETAVSGSYIVMLGEKADKSKLAKEYGGKLQRNYSSSINGFSASGKLGDRGQAPRRRPVRAKVVQNKKFSINARPGEPAVVGSGPRGPGRDRGRQRVQLPRRRR
ncbi:S8 family peptidase OS=Streptomyces microflavus OX=1919 GN=G3I39_09465 PE=3 SV=1 [Streptomyces microflavus]